MTVILRVQTWDKHMYSSTISKHKSYPTQGMKVLAQLYTNINVSNTHTTYLLHIYQYTHYTYTNINYTHNTHTTNTL